MLRAFIHANVHSYSSGEGHGGQRVPSLCDHKTPFSSVVLDQGHILSKAGLWYLWKNFPTIPEIVKSSLGASLVAQWLRICLPTQGTRVRALVWEDPTCRGATGPVSHNY